MSDETPTTEADPAVADTTEEPTPVEKPVGDAPAEGDPATEAAAEGEAAPVEGEAKPEGEEQPAAAEAKPVEIPEEALKAAAVKYANRTMAAARRAEARVEHVTADNARLTSTVKEYEGFVEGLKRGDATQLKRIGFSGVKHFLEAVRDAGGEPKPASVEDELGQWRKEREDEKREGERAKQVAAREADRTRVFAAIDAQAGTRYGHATTSIGRDKLWAAIEAYQTVNGSCPNPAVFALADAVEKDLAGEFGPSAKLSGRPAVTKTGTSPANAAASAGKKSGGTLTNRATSGAPAVREYSLDPEERRRQVNEDMRTSGELAASS